RARAVPRRRRGLAGGPLAVDVAPRVALALPAALRPPLAGALALPVAGDPLPLAALPVPAARDPDVAGARLELLRAWGGGRLARRRLRGHGRRRRAVVAHVGRGRAIFAVIADIGLGARGPEQGGARDGEREQS